MAFFLESTFIGLFFFGWERLSKLCTAAVALSKPCPLWRGGLPPIQWVSLGAGG